MQPIIMHLDMNSYFASVEQQDNLAWRGKPVGVCEHLGGIIIAASVEAKKWGIKTGTPVWEAKKVYPQIILTQTHPDRYRFYTKKFVDVVSEYTDKVEKYSIDEVFADITASCNIKISKSRYQIPNKIQTSKFESQNHGLAKFYNKIQKDMAEADPWEEAASIALEIKRRFKNEVGDWLRCSIGIADNKVLAKIASDMRKPNGLVVVRPFLDCHSGILRSKISGILPNNKKIPAFAGMTGIGEAENGGFLQLTKDDLYHQLKLTDIPGIGKRQEKNLNELRIKTLADLRDCPKSRLVARFGSIGGHHLYNLGQLHGSWKEQVRQEQEIKSMGHMYTLPKEFREAKFFLPVLYKLCEMVGRRLRRRELMGNIIYFFVHPHTNIADQVSGFPAASRWKTLPKTDGGGLSFGNLNNGNIGVGARDSDWQGFGKSIKLKFYLQDGRDIFLQILGFYPDIIRQYARGSLQIKLIGVTVAGLCPYINQLSLFGDVEQERRLVAALDDINDKYGEFTVTRALQMPAGKVFRDSIGFGRVKEM